MTYERSLTKSLRRESSNRYFSHTALVCAALLAAACGRDSGAAAKSSAVVVSTAPVVRADVPLEVLSFGIVEASSTVEVVPQVTGLITEVHFKEGDFVEKGKHLFTVDTRSYRASLGVARAEVARNDALAEQAKVEADRAQRLAAEGIVSEQELARARAQAQATAANVALSRAAMRSAGLNVAFTRITSPIDGLAGSLLVHAGNVVSAGSPQPLVVVRDVSPVQVRFAVPEEHLERIRALQSKGALTVRVTPKGQGSKPVEGPLTFIENTVDPSTGTLALKATFPNLDRALWPGAAVDVALVLDVERGVVVAPDAAVQRGQEGAYAFVVENRRAKLRRIELARTAGERVVIRGGLEPGEQVVTDGQVRLRDGSEVEPRAAPAAAGSARDGSEATLR